MNSMERNGDTVHFEPKVMQVLLALASEPGEVVTREHLRKAVWPDVFVGEDVLIRAISELRRAFSDDPREPHTIQTIPKVGYRLRPLLETLQKNPNRIIIAMDRRSHLHLIPSRTLRNLRPRWRRLHLRRARIGGHGLFLSSSSFWFWRPQSLDFSGVRSAAILPPRTRAPEITRAGRSPPIPDLNCSQVFLRMAALSPLSGSRRASGTDIYM
jgi:DNA-binding winged helix-turn-helix (wHTH) protein